MQRIISLFLLFMLPTVALAEEVSYSAIVMDITGKVEVLHQGKNELPDLGDLLYPGDGVEIARDASLTINYPESGKEEQWPGGMKFTVGKTQSEDAPSQVIKRDRKIMLPQIESPQQGKFTLRGSRKIRKIEVKGLSNTLVLEQKPTFRWYPIEGADIYKVTLSLEFEDKPLWQKTIANAEIPYSQSELPLKLGSFYEWKVKALKDGELIALKNSYFDMPTNEDFKKISNQKKSFEDMLSNHPGDTSTRLAFIFFLEYHRLYDDAIKQYEIIIKDHKESGSMRKRKEYLLQIRLSDTF